MSSKSKNLSYEAQEPAFLRKLRAQQAGADVDRQERPVARPRRMRAGGEEDDEGPMIVDEEGYQTVSKEEYDALVAAEKGDEDRAEESGLADAAPPDSVDGEGQRRKQEVTEAGQTHKKRKAVKAIAVDDEDKEAEIKPDEKVPKQQSKKPKKKIKAVKLSFNEPED